MKLKFVFSQKLSTFGYPNTNETVYLIKITVFTNATGKSNVNRNALGKLNRSSLEQRDTSPSATSDQNLLIAYLASLLKN